MGTELLQTEKPNGVWFGTMSDASGLPQRWQTVLSERCGSLLPDARSGNFLVIDDDTTPDAPLRVSHRAESAEETSHLIVIVGARSRVTIVEELRSEGEGTWTHDVEIFCDDESSVTFTSVNLATMTMHIRQRSSVGNGASMTWNNATIGGDVDQDLQSRVTGAHGMSGINWIAYAKGAEKQTLNVRNIFDATDGEGEIVVKGVAEEKAHITCKGMIDIGLTGGGTNTYLTQNVLMLDKTAKVDAIPALEIKTNDVKASHSATVSRVTDEDLFYFAARGIDRTEARGMFVRGFLADLTKHLDDGTRELVTNAIDAKFAMSA